MPLDDSSLSEQLTRDLDQNDPETTVIRAQLEELVRHAVAKEGDDSAEVAISRLQNAKRRSSWKLPLLLACLSVVLLIAGSYRDLMIVAADQAGSNPPAIFKGLRERATRPLIDADAIYPAESIEDWEGRLRRACEREPDSAGSYYVYAGFLRMAKQELPPDFDTVTARLEPDNAIWPLLKADWQIGQAMARGKSPREPDPVWLSQAAESMRKAAACPRIDHHFKEIGHLWRRSLHPVTVAEAVALTPGDMNGDRVALHPDEGITNTFPIVAKSLTNPGDLRSFLKISGPFLIRNILSQDCYQSWSIPAESMGRFAFKAGLKDEAERFKRLDVLDDSVWDQGRVFPKKQGFWSILDTQKFWPDFIQDWDSSELDLRLLNRIAALKTALLASGAVCLLAGAVAWLRLIPFPAMSAKLAFCVSPLVNRRSRIIRTAMVLFVVMFATWGLAGVVSESEQREGARLLIVTLSAATLLGLSFAFQSARASVSISTAVIGLGGSRRQLLLGRLVKWLSLLAVGFWIASTYASDFQLFTIALTGCILIYWMVRLVLGFAKPVDNVRHRLMAGILVPVFFTVSIGFALAGLGTGAVEKHLVQKAWASAPEPRQEISAENRAALEALMKEWQ